jgi:hypothetical protein
MFVMGSFDTVGTGFAEVAFEIVAGLGSHTLDSAADCSFHTADFGCTDCLAGADYMNPAGVDCNETGQDEMSGLGTTVLEYTPTS